MPAISRPIQKHKFKSPKARIHLNDLAHEGSSIFLSNIKGNEDIDTQIQNVLNLLYTADDITPGTRSVTLVLRPTDGVAYTSGTDLDSDHKEIHFNLNYITGIKGEPRHEILGVICHELVHCFQWNAQGTCPGGLIEGIADWVSEVNIQFQSALPGSKKFSMTAELMIFFPSKAWSRKWSRLITLGRLLRCMLTELGYQVRLRANLGAKHWNEDPDDKWDAGYQDTGYFLDYLERRFGDGTVRKFNGCLRAGKYDEKKLFKDCCEGHRVKDLWKDYKEDFKDRKGDRKEENSNPPESTPTHAVQRV